VFLSRYGRRSFEYYTRRFGTVGGLRPIYPSMPWGRYVPALADEHIGATADAARRVEACERVWAILVWAGFKSLDEDSQPLRTSLRCGFVE
jgi:hypothetical protein